MIRVTNKLGDAQEVIEFDRYEDFERYQRYVYEEKDTDNNPLTLSYANFHNGDCRADFVTMLEMVTSGKYLISVPSRSGDFGMDGHCETFEIKLVKI